MVSKRFRVEGITDEVTTCDHCGKKNLKRTVLLVDNETDDELYFGTSCAAEALGWPERTPAQQMNRAYKEVMDLRAKCLADGARYAETLTVPEVVMDPLETDPGRWKIVCDDTRILRFEQRGGDPIRRQQDRWYEDVVKAWRLKRAEEWAADHGMPPVPKA